MSNQEKLTPTIDDNKLIAERKEKLASIRENCSANGHPNHFKPNHYAQELQKEHGEQDKETVVGLNKVVSVAGRVMAKRGPFFVIQDMTGRIQAYAPKDAQKDMKARWGSLDIGDIIGVKGQLKLSGHGDLFVTMEEYHLLTKSLRPLPEKHAGLKDQEIKYRQRYVDLITSEETRQNFLIRSKSH